MGSPRFPKCDIANSHDPARVSLEQLIDGNWVPRNYCWWCYCHLINEKTKTFRGARFLDR